MAKTRDVYNVKVYLSKTDVLEWNNVEDLEYIDDNTVSFYNQKEEEITVSAPAHLMVVTKREEVVIG